MALKPKRPPAEGEFLFEIDPEPLEECVTSLGGVPLVVRTARSLGVPGGVRRHLHLKKRDRGLDEPRYVESFLVLDAVSGDCLEDFDRLREDAGLAQRLGHEVPGAAKVAASGLSRRTALQAKGFPKTHFFSCGSICPKSRPKALPRRSAAARRSLDHLDTGFCGIDT